MFSQIETMGAREVDMRRGAMKRCLTNLVDNADTHGSQVALSVRVTRRFLDGVRDEIVTLSETLVAEGRLSEARALSNLGDTDGADPALPRGRSPQPGPPSGGAAASPAR